MPVNVLLELTRLQKEVLELDTPAEQVRKIVASVSKIVGADVCTLYMLGLNDDMVLVASHGLAQTGTIVIPAGKGLVGLAARSGWTVAGALGLPTSDADDADAPYDPATDVPNPTNPFCT